MSLRAPSRCSWSTRRPTSSAGKRWKEDGEGRRLHRHRRGRGVRASGYTTLSPRQINAAYEDITSMSVPFSDKTTVKIQGVRSAFEGIKQMVYASPPTPSPTPRPGTSARSRRWGCSSTSSMPRARARPSPGSRTWAWPTTPVSSAKATWPPVPQGPHLDGHLRPRLGRAHIRSRFLPGPDSQ